MSEWKGLSVTVDSVSLMQSPPQGVEPGIRLQLSGTLGTVTALYFCENARELVQEFYGYTGGKISLKKVKRPKNGQKCILLEDFSRPSLHSTLRCPCGFLLWTQTEQIHIEGRQVYLPLTVNMQVQGTVRVSEDKTSQSEVKCRQCDCVFGYFIRATLPQFRHKLNLVEVPVTLLRKEQGNTPCPALVDIPKREMVPTFSLDLEIIKQIAILKEKCEGKTKI